MNRHPLQAGFLVLFCLALLTITTCIPVHAADPGPSADDRILPIEKAHLAWMAEVSDVEMVAAIAYVETLFGKDTSGMTSIHTDFSKAKSAIGSITSLSELDNHTSLMQETARLFNQETMDQISTHQGKPENLKAQISKAVNANPYIAMKKDAYWSTRSTYHLDEFDAWVSDTQNTLNILQAQGYPVSDTSPYLVRFASLRTDLKASLNTKDFDRAESTAVMIRDRSSEITDRIAALQTQVTTDTTADFRLGEADRVIARADRVNPQLVKQILDIGDAEPVLSKLKIDVKQARGAQNGGQSGLVYNQLQLIKKDYRDLAAAYRDIAVSASLAPGMADILKAMSYSLEETANRIGES
ncbi:MAG: hypothetical protein ACYDDV_08765 [Methanoregula sp.]